MARAYMVRELAKGLVTPSKPRQTSRKPWSLGLLAKLTPRPCRRSAFEPPRMGSHLLAWSVATCFGRMDAGESGGRLSSRVPKTDPTPGHSGGLLCLEVGPILVGAICRSSENAFHGKA